MEWYSNFFARSRGLIAMGVIAMTVFAAIGHSLEYFTDWTSERADEPWNDEIAFFRDIREQFPGIGDEAIALVLRGSDLFDPAEMSAARRIIAAVEKEEAVASVYGLDRVPVFRKPGLSLLRNLVIPGRLVPSEGSDPEEFAKARQEALEHPMIAGQLISEDAATLVAPVIPDSEEFGREDLERIGSLVRTLSADEPVDAYLTGRYALQQAEDAGRKRDVQRFGLVGYILVVVLAGVLFRGFSVVCIVALAPSLGLFWTWGILDWIGFEALGLTGVIVPVIVTMIGLADGVHLMVDIRSARAHGLSPIDAARYSVHHLGLACLLTSVTTAISFFSLVMAENEEVRNFGFASAVGCLVTFVAVLTVIPLLCSTWLGKRIDKGHEHDVIGRSLERFDWIIDGILRRPATVTTLGVFVTGILLVVSATLEPDIRIKNAVSNDAPSYEGMLIADEAVGGIQFLYVAIDWPEGSSATAPETLAAIEDVEKVLSAQPTVRGPTSLRTLRAALPNGGEGRFERLLPKEIKALFVQEEVRRTLVRSRVTDAGIAVYEPVFRDLERELDELETRHEGYAFRITGIPVAKGRTVRTTILELTVSLMAAAVIIFAVIGIAYRSMKIAVIVVVPTLFPLAITATGVAALDRDMEIAMVCAFTICLGIAVDDAIHFISRFRHEVSLKPDVPHALRRSFERVGNAMIVTTVIMLAGFGSLLFGELPAHRMFAAIACGTIGSALIADLVILPAMLAYFVKASDVHEDHAEEEPDWQ